MTIAKEVFNTARSVYLNDGSAQIYTDSALLPHLREAHRDLQLNLMINGIPVVREVTSAPIVVNVGVIFLTLPSDFIMPIKLSERAQGSQDQWTPMEEVDFEPSTTPDLSLIYWSWREEKINFVGATTPREVQMRYKKGLTLPVNENSQMGFLLSEVFLAPQTAQYAARAIGSTSLADDNLRAAELKLDLVIRANLKGQQSLPVRRIPYRRYRRTGFVM